MPDQFKPSEFNYHQSRLGTHVIYNTLYRSLVKMNRCEYDMYAGLRPAEASLQSELIDTGLWVARDLNERATYLELADAIVSQLKHPPSCTITTTFRCNARCAYCYEQNLDATDFEAKDAGLLVDFIVEQALSNTTGAVMLNWFGGEPLLNPELIETVTSSLDVRGIPFLSYIITNGSLLSDDIIRNKLRRWKVRDMQVTIDGRKEQYKARKAYVTGGEAVYESLMLKLERVAQERIFLHLRLNTERSNAEEQIETVRELEQRFSPYENVVFYPAFLTGVSNPLNDVEKEQIVYEMLSALNDPTKLTSDSKLYSFPHIRACMREDPSSFTVDVHGNLFNCERAVGRSELSIGSLRDGIDAQANQKRVQRRLREDCMQCIFLPKCLGGCHASYEAGDSACMIERYLIPAYARLLLD